LTCGLPAGARPLEPDLTLGDKDDFASIGNVELLGRGRIHAGPGDDEISGSGALFGGPGRDEIVGGPARDVIVPGSGVDRVEDSGGGAVIRARDRNPDVIDCGPGDEVVFADVLDYTTRGTDREECFRIRRRGAPRGVAISAVSPADDAFHVTIGCPRDALRRCTGWLTMFDHRSRRVGRRPFRARPGGKDVVYKALASPVERRLRRHGTVVIAETKRPDGSFLVARSSLVVDVTADLGGTG
jgi:hypothetical protein